ncbi:HAD hydrolase family protein [Candidatus Amarobacter glycogenicus]|uniref:HAD family hydrolase n=1 Tax=Candidatus Amarobacter glycogenicus TaxID=3140699 RepID=UPI003134DD23|nr:HAD hydrolase family protein [Dehalococcoidia bacterium]
MSARPMAPSSNSALDGDFALFLAGLCDRAGWTATLSTPERAYRRANELPPWAAMAPEWLKPVTRFEGEHLQNALSVLAEAAPRRPPHARTPGLGRPRQPLSCRRLQRRCPHHDHRPPASTRAAASGLSAPTLGIDPSEAAAIGDSEVDIPMFEVAGASIAMADGTPEARAAARTQTLAADEDGVAAYLESIL